MAAAGTKARGRYLENRLVQLTRSADRANLANSNEPSKKSLPESDIADMEFFLEQIQLILPVVGFDFLRPRLIPAATAPVFPTSPTSLTTSQLDLVPASPIISTGTLPMLLRVTAKSPS